MTLDAYRRSLGWSVSELARRANVDYTSAKKALDGKSISGKVAVALASAISEAQGETIHFSQIEGLNVNL